jgi:hypothetical protein
MSFHKIAAVGWGAAACDSWSLDQSSTT